MAKTLFSDGNPLQGILGTIVNAAFLNKIFSHRHDGLDQDGSAPLEYAADTGAANAYAIALTPALTAHVAGLPIHFKAANANTGASTLVVNGLDAVAIKQVDGSDLPAGAIVAGQIVSVIYTGAVYMLVSAAAAITTPAQFDASKKPVNAEFVQRALGNMRGTVGYSASTILTSNDVGKLINIFGVGTKTITLPASNTLPQGACILFHNTGGDVATLQCSGADYIYVNASGTISSLLIQSGGSLYLHNTGSGGWFACGGSEHLKYVAGFDSSLNSSGYQKLPSGLLLQWGTGSVNITTTYQDVSITFPMAFPGAYFAPVFMGRNGTAQDMFFMEKSRTGAGVVVAMRASTNNASNYYWIAIGF